MSVDRGWIAAKGISFRKLVEELGFSLMGITWELDTKEADITAARFESGWFTILFRGNPLHAADTEIIADASVHAELIISCAASEHSMTSQAWGFRGGEEIWDILHAPDLGQTHLEVNGPPRSASRPSVRDISTNCRPTIRWANSMWTRCSRSPLRSARPSRDSATTRPMNSTTRVSPSSRSIGEWPFLILFRCATPPGAPRELR